MRKCALLLFMALLVLGMAGCEGDNDSRAEFEGVWMYDTSVRGTALSYTDTFTITETAMNRAFTGDYDGTAVYTIDNYDVDLKQIEATCTSSSGTGLGTQGEVGTTYYFSYSIIGNNLYFAISSVAYNVVSTTKPYVKQ